MLKKKRSKNALKNNILSTLAGIIILISIVITINDLYLNLNFIPNWNSIFALSKLDRNKKIINGENVSVHFIDVGQGDSQLIFTPEHSVLIDTGENKYAEKVINYLKAQNIKKLNYVILTHPHSDHAGGFLKIADEFKVENLLMPQIPDELIPTTATFSRIIEGIEKHSINTKYVYPGQTIKLDDSEINIIGPVDNVYKNLNNYSIVFKFTHGENSFLFTGDMEKHSENDIYDTGIDLSANVLKVSHHGSNGSSQKKILNSVGGKYAVIGVSADNSYKHPGEKTLERLRDLNYEIYRTDKHGDIVFISNGIDYEIITTSIANEKMAA